MTGERTRDIADNAAKEGITPLEYMLNILRKHAPEGADAKTQLDYDALGFGAAKAAGRMSAIAAQARIVEVDDLEHRVKALEERSAGEATWQTELFGQAEKS